MYEIEL